jgi:hypothetical protein
VSIYDLAGLQISADNGRTVYLVVSNVPLTKVDISGQNYNTNIWLPVSQVILNDLATATTIPKITTEVATVGDTIATFKILEIKQSAVEGNYTITTPSCCRYQTMTIQLRNDIGASCAGISEMLESIDFQNQLAVFARTVSPPPAGGCPICLSGDTLIDTPNGQVNVKDVTVGTRVWTVDTYGHRVAATVLETRKISVAAGAQIIHVILQDGRQMYVSPGHPTSDGRLFGQLKVGDVLSNSTVVVAELVPYDQAFTYDLLPGGQTGFYWANGILVGSTLTEAG